MSLIKYHTNDQAGTFADVWNTLLGSGSAPAFTAPRVNIQESDKAFEVQVEAPGRAKEDFALSLEDGILKISAESKEENAETQSQYKIREFRLHKFERAFRLPKNIDAEASEASYEGGILTIVLPKIAASKARRLEVK